MGRLKRIKIACLALITALVILIMPLSLCVNVTVAADENTPTVYVLTNTFGGLSVLLKCNGYFGLIDSGEVGSIDYSIPYFKDLGVTKDKFKFFIGTHPHSGHIGAAKEIIREFRPDRVYLQEYSDSYIKNSDNLRDSRNAYERTIAAARATGAELIQNINSGNADFYLGGSEDSANATTKFTDAQAMKIEIKNYGDDYKYQPTDDANDFSLGVLVTANNKKLFVSGDINNFGGDEDKLAKEIGDIDSLVLGHHGLYGSNSYNYITTLNPELMIIPGSFSNVSEKGLTYDKGLLETLWYMGTKTNPSKLFATEWLREAGYKSLNVYLNTDGVTTNVPSDFEYFATTTMENGIEVGINYKNGIQCKYNGDTVDGKGEIQVDGKRFIRAYNNGFYMTGDWEGGNYIQGDANAWKFKSTITNQYVTGKNYINGFWYCFDSEGKILSDWQTVDGYQYYFGPTGSAETDGKMRYGDRGWLSIDGTYYYLAIDGKMMQNCWITDYSGRQFFLNADGTMAKNQTLSYYRTLGDNGALSQSTKNGDTITLIGNYDSTKPWAYIDGLFYFITGSTGAYKTGIMDNYGGTDYYFSTADGDNGFPKGAMVTGPCKVQENGVEKLYYYSTKTEITLAGATGYGEGAKIKFTNEENPWIQTKDGRWYRIQEGNTLRTGWFKDNVNNKWYYFDPDTGEMQTGLIKAGNNYYYLRRKGDGGSEGSMIDTVGVFTACDSKSYYITSTDGYIAYENDSSGFYSPPNQGMVGYGYQYYIQSDKSIAKGVTKIGNEFFYFVNDGEEEMLGQPVGTLVTTPQFIHSTDGYVYYVYGTGTDTAADQNGFTKGRLFDFTIQPESWLGWLRLDVDGKKEYYCFDDLAAMQKGFVETNKGQSDNRMYYEAMAEGTITVNGITFKEGQMIYGGRFLADDGSGNYYFANKDDVTGNLLTGVQQDSEGKYYYFINGDEQALPDGQPANPADKYKMVTAKGWITDKEGNKYYVKSGSESEDESDIGTLATGATNIDGKWYYFCAGNEAEIPSPPSTETNPKYSVGQLVTTVGWIEIPSSDSFGYTRYYVYGTGTDTSAGGNGCPVGQLFDKNVPPPTVGTNSWEGWLPLGEGDNLEFYSFTADAKMQKAFENVAAGTSVYYLDPKGDIKINQKTFKKGQMVYGGKFTAHDGNDYFANNSAIMAGLRTGIQQNPEDNKNYYFQTGSEKLLPSGTASATNKYQQVKSQGWVRDENDNWYYIDSNEVCYETSRVMVTSNISCKDKLSDSQSQIFNAGTNHENTTYQIKAEDTSGNKLPSIYYKTSGDFVSLTLTDGVGELTLANVVTAELVAPVGYNITVEPKSGENTINRFDYSPTVAITNGGTTVEGDTQTVELNKTLAYVFTNTYSVPRTKLTISTAFTDGTKVGNGETIIYTLRGDDSDPMTKHIELTVSTKSDGNGSLTPAKINDLPTGKYIVTQDKSWAWRYEPQSIDYDISGGTPTFSDYTASITLAKRESGENQLTFNNATTNSKWLDGNSYVENRFN